MFCSAMATLLGVTIFAAALGMQHIMQLEPCPLCIFQRVTLIAATGAAAASFTCSLLGWARTGKLLALFSGVVALSGLGIALRHMYVMWVPQEMGCGANRSLNVLKSSRFASGNL